MPETFRVSLEPAQLQANVGGDPVTTTLVVQNTGLQVDQYNIELSGLEATWYNLDVTGVALFPQDSNQVKLTIRVPKGGARAGTYPFNLRVASRANPDQVETVSGQLEVIAFAVFDFSMSPEKVTGRRGNFNLTIKNGGNTDLDINLRGRDPEDKLRYNFKPANPKVTAGSTLEMKLALSAQRSGFVGEPKSFRFTLTATPTADRTLAKTVQGEFAHKPWLRSWRPILMPFVILLVVVALLVGFRSIPWGQFGFGSEAATVTNLVSGFWNRLPFFGQAQKEKPFFKEGFKEFHDLHPQLVGDPLENEMPDAAGNTYQLTTRGILVWFKPSSTHYFFGPEGVFQLRSGQIRQVDGPPRPR